MELRIGILECDHVDPKLRDKYGDYHEMFADLIHQLDSSIEFSVYDLVGGHLPVDLFSCDAYIITGSRSGVYEDFSWISDAKQLVRRLYEAKIPTIGICFGHQLIAQSLGGKVIKAEDKGRGLGVQTWNVSAKLEWMSEFIPSLALNACHQDQVVKLPEDSELFMGSEFCPIAAFQKGSMLGIQGHPEFDTEYTEYLLEKYKNDLNCDEVKISEESFKIPANSNFVGAWMLEFIKTELA